MIRDHQERVLGGGLAALWLVVAVVADFLLGSTVSLGALYALSPLIACAVLPAAGTAVFAAATVVLVLVSAAWNDTWGSLQQTTRLVDVMAVSGIAVVVAMMRVRRNQQYARAVTLAEDATRTAQQAGERLSAVLDTMLDAVTVGSAVRDSAGRVIDFRVDYTNAASVEMFRQPAEDLVGRRWSELWPESFSSGLLSLFVHTVETGEPVEFTDLAATMETPNGPVPVVVDLRAARLGDSVVAARREVTERHRAAHAVAEAAAQFTAAFEHAPVGMMLIDVDGAIVRANPAFGAITGHRPDELVGTPFAALVDPRDVPQAHRDLEHLIAGGEPVRRGERRLMTVEGEARWVATSVARVARDNGTYVVAHIEDIHERKAFEGRLRYLADHDALTGLFNRRRFHEELARLVALDARYGHSSAVVLVDLDNFKYINDTLGHRTGDQLIQVIARALHSRLRSSDVIGRLGGDEFGVLLPGADEHDALTVAGSLLEAVRTSEVEHAGHRVRSTGSIGIAKIESGELTDADEVLANADLAMYAAKEAGRNTSVVYDPAGAHAERSRARFRWLDRIRHALDHGLFTVQVQPILDLARGEVTGCELLVRIREQGTLVCPDQFLHIAERHGLATAIDRLVIEQGISLAATHPQPSGFRWEINLSADSLGDPGIPAFIEAMLADTGVPSESLVFEITETAAISNMDQARAFAGRITDIGCRFALDDFGAGYGSFYYLKHLPFEYLKIDGEFIRQLTTSDVDRVIVEAIVAAATRLGKQTVAEYVGDAATLDLLRRLRVDHAQGYYIGRPTEPDVRTVVPTPRIARDV